MNQLIPFIGGVVVVVVAIIVFIMFLSTPTLDQILDSGDCKAWAQWSIDHAGEKIKFTDEQDRKIIHMAFACR